MIDSLFTYWGWFVAALLLAGIEIAAPGFFMIWLAAAALATGIGTFVLDLGWEMQLVTFAILSVAAILGGRAYLHRNPIASDDPALNRRADRLVGEIVTVIEPIVGGQGRVQVADSPWLATGPDMAAGRRARIVRADGSRLVVEPVA